MGSIRDRKAAPAKANIRLQDQFSRKKNGYQPYLESTIFLKLTAEADGGDEVS